ncbi:ABC transporter permease [Leifsonia shinshuensis]|uniref:ABC transporter permease n=1 Tax=Leifsonia shinshuensis TaxID=150026 RepID=UPI00285924C5|nr:ABC transporter permease [Leifsonia shinshuensis]MDR6971661.1 simple sugar transport system permease protein [Leifsonia shinshuensis]
MYEFLATAIRDAAPLLWVALGGLLAYRVGVFNLGLEGLMAIAAFTAVAAAKATGSIALTLLITAAVTVAVSIVYWLCITILKGDVIIVGIGLSTVGLALTVFMLNVFYGSQATANAPVALPEPIPSTVRGGPMQIMAGMSILVWILPVVALIVWVVLRRTQAGLVMNAVGEFPFAARSAGQSPTVVRFWAIAAGGVLIAMGGAELSLGGLDSFSQDMTAGRGFLAFSALIFGGGTVWGVVGACAFFGVANALGILAQVQGWSLPTEFLLAIPYILTILAVTVAAYIAKRAGGNIATFAELRD